MNESFEIVGVKPELLERQVPEKENRWYQGVPWLAVIVLLIIAGGCLFCKWIMPKDPSYMDLKNYTVAPCREFLFGTDTMGRDIFSMIWYGGRQSLFIGIVATVISTGIAVVFGTVSGLAPEWLDMLLMRMTEILLSIPNLLLVIFLQAILEKANVLSLSLVIGVTSWTSIAKVVRTEVRQLRSNEYVVAARCMGGGFFYILRKHLAPNFLSSIMFMVVMNIRSAIVEESTLSFMGIGLPLEIISWGSMLSLSEKALLTDGWWIILIPGAFLVVTLLAITGLGDYLRKELNKKESYL
jgi:peptide/nickel transport system permease protein